MSRAKLGDRVRVQYLGLREDGSAIRHSRGRQVLEFTVGSKEVMPGISLGVVGMAEGEQKRLTLQPKDAYGTVRPKLIKEVSRQRFPSRLELFVGKRLTATSVNSGRRRRVEVAELDRKSTRLNSSHSRASRMPSSA